MRFQLKRAIGVFLTMLALLWTVALHKLHPIDPTGQRPRQPKTRSAFIGLLQSLHAVADSINGIDDKARIRCQL